MIILASPKKSESDLHYTTLERLSTLKIRVPTWWEHGRYDRGSAVVSVDMAFSDIHAAESLMACMGECQWGRADPIPITVKPAASHKSRRKVMTRRDAA